MLTPDELNAVPEALVWLAGLVFIFGGLICVVNFWIFLNWIFPSLRMNPEEPYRHVSAIPIVGSLLVYFMLRTLGSIPAVMLIGVVLIAIDAGGIHWGLLGLPYVGYQHWRKRRAERKAADDMGEGK
jgi:hypothetical protein